VKRTAMLELCIACMHGPQQMDNMMQQALEAAGQSVQIAAAAVQNGQIVRVAEHNWVSSRDPVMLST
jgi:hypothetical protein